MPNVSQVVSRLIRNRPFLEQALVSGIINYAYLADALKPEVEVALRKKVNRYAIAMALRRLTEQLKESFIGEAGANLADADIMTTSGIFEMTLLKDARSIESVSKLYSMVDLSRGDFLTITQGIYEITVLSNSRYKERMKKLFRSENIVNTTDGLASLTVRIPLKAADAVGVLYQLTKALSWENINIVEVVSTLREEIFIIRENDTPIAYEAIKGLVGQQEVAGR
jgi:hypothetical protein